MPKNLASSRRFNPDALDEAARKRNQHTAIRRYLDALEFRQVPRGRPANAAQVQERLDAVREQLAVATPVARVQLIQERMNLEHELAGLVSEGAETFEMLEAAFIAQVADWAERKNVSYAALREAGVSARVLRDAGVPRR